MTYDNECIQCKHTWQTGYKPMMCARFGCASTTLKSVLQVPNTAPATTPTWGATQPTVAEPTPTLSDQRKTSLTYGPERELATGCNCDGKYKECLWGRKASYGEGCAYHRFNIMCDKVTHNGKSIN
jgi:hypothetical protein